MVSMKQAWRQFRQMRGLPREAVTILLCLLLGLAVMPIAVYVVGQRLFGPYVDGGYGAYLLGLIRSMAQLSLAHWLFALGPYGAVWLWRIWRWGWREN
jgi:hypothetical protein